MIKRNLNIDWAWVKKSLLKKERITPLSEKIILASVEEAIKKAKKLTKPKALVVKKKAPLLESKSLSANINGAEYVCLFLVTIGPALETEASNLMNGEDSLIGYLLDRIGSITVETLAQSLEDSVRKEYTPKDKSVSARLSPGYCDWPIEEQVKLDELLNFSKVGVHLTENCMMSPRKSISGLMAIGPKGLFSKNRPRCLICKIKNCLWRGI